MIDQFDTGFPEFFPLMVPSVDELVEAYHQPYSEGDSELSRIEHYGMIAMQLHMNGASGRKVLWRELDTADFDQKQGIILALALEPRDQGKLRRRLVQMLGSENPDDVQVAIEGLEFQRDRKSKKKVLALLDHPDAEVKAAILSYITTLYPTEALPVLLDATRHEDADVRYNALQNILRLSVLHTSEEIREAASRLRKDRDKLVRDWARPILDDEFAPPDELVTLANETFEYMHEIGHAPTWRDVRRSERDQDWYDVDLPLMGLAMRDRGNRQLRQRINQWLESDDSWEVHTAIMLITATGDWERKDEILALRASEDELIASGARLYHRLLDPEAAIQEHVELLGSTNSSERLTAIERLSQILAIEADPRVRARLEEMQDDPDNDVRTLAEFALAPEWRRRFGDWPQPE